MLVGIVRKGRDLDLTFQIGHCLTIAVYNENDFSLSSFKFRSSSNPGPTLHLKYCLCVTQNCGMHVVMIYVHT